jgi:hypothetical protein
LLGITEALARIGITDASLPASIAVDQGFMRGAARLGALARPGDAAAEGLAMCAQLGVFEIDLDRLLIDMRLDGSVLAISLA